MMQWELEIPGKIFWKFETIDDAKKWALRLMIDEVHQVNIYILNIFENRKRLYLTYHKNGEICPWCYKKQGLVHIVRQTGCHSKLLTCRQCGLSFKKHANFYDKVI